MNSDGKNRLMERMRIPILIALLIFGSIGYGQQGVQAEAEHLEPITVAVTPWTGSAAFFVAHVQGYFKEEGLDATFRFPVSGHMGLEDVIAGKADLATAGETPIVRAAVDGRPLSVVATVAKIDRAILIIAGKDYGISSPEDLKGKRVGVVAGTTADFFLHIYLSTNYINPRDVQIVDIAPDSIVKALMDGEVDAVSTWAPHTLVLQEKLGAEAVVFSDSDIYTMTWNLAASRKAIRDRPDRIRKFLRAIVRANEMIAKSPSRARAICAKYVGNDGLFFESEWRGCIFTAELDQSLLLNLEDQARWIIENNSGKDTALPDFMEYIDVEPLRSARSEAVRIAGE